MKHKTNRPLVGKKPTERYNVSLPPEVAARLRKAGGGNLSAGIREADKALVKAKKAPISGESC